MSKWTQGTARNVDDSAMRKVLAMPKKAQERYMNLYMMCGQQRLNGNHVEADKIVEQLKKILEK